MNCKLSQLQDKNCGPGYSSPLNALQNGLREKLLYVSTVSLTSKQDKLLVVDVDPESCNYNQIVGACKLPTIGDELHHFGWNSCSSCYFDVNCKRNKLILPCLNSSKIYVIEVGEDGKDLKVIKVIEDLKESLKVSVPHTVHCAPDKSLIISCLGDENENGKGSLIRMDAINFDYKCLWSSDTTAFGYDFWYQPRLNVLITSEWGSPNCWKKGFDLNDVQKKNYGQSIHVYEWMSRKKIQTIDLGDDGLMPLEVRFLHNPDKAHAFVGCALGSSIFHIFLDEDDDSRWKAEKVIQVEKKKVQNWLLDEMPGIITDIIISLDDKFLYFSNWIQGDVRQYNVENPFIPIFVGNIYLGGSFCNDSRIKLRQESENDDRPSRPVIKGKPLRGGPQMLQLSLDGKRLYISNSLYSSWDRQFYPELVEQGSLIVKIDIDQENGMKLDYDFLIDFDKNVEDGPMLAHEMRYPGGDCTSDIWC